MLQLNKIKYATEEDKTYGIDYWAKLFKATTWEELKLLAEKQASLQSTVETMYRFTADDYTREEIRAREEALRVQRTIESIHKSELKERDDKIAEQMQQLSDKDKEIARLKEQLKALQKQATSQKSFS